MTRLRIFIASVPSIALVLYGAYCIFGGHAFSPGRHARWVTGGAATKLGIIYALGGIYFFFRALLDIPREYAKIMDISFFILVVIITLSS